MNGSKKVSAYLAAYTLGASSNYFFVKDGLSYSSPLLFMSLRYAIAGASLLIPLAVLRRFKPFMNLDLFLLSLFTALSTGFWSFGLLYVDPGTSAVLSYTMPLFALPLSMLILGERPSGSNVIGIIIGFLGVMIYYLSFLGSVKLIGAILTVINAFFWAMYSTYFRKLGSRDPLTVVSLQMLISAALMLIPSLMLGIHLLMKDRFIIDLLGTGLIGGSMLFLLWNLLINSMGVSRAVALVFLVPALTMGMDYLLLGIMPTPLELIGAVVMFVGIYASQRPALSGKGKPRLF